MRKCEWHDFVFLANTDVRIPLPVDLRVPARSTVTRRIAWHRCRRGKSTGTVFPPQAWGTTQGWQGLLVRTASSNSVSSHSSRQHLPRRQKNGGISGMVVYASTRPFDDPSLSLQLSWSRVSGVKINLYSKSVDANGNDVLTLVDTTNSASWDDWPRLPA